MNFKAEKLEGNKAKLTIEVPEEVFDKSMEKAFKSIIGRINVPGFRKGKAPRALVEKMYGRELFLEDAIKDCVPVAFTQALDEAGKEYDCLVYPDYDIVSSDKGQGLVFTATYDMKPEVTLGNYKGLKLEEVKEGIEEDAVEKEIKAMQERFSRLEKTEEPLENGDTAVIDFLGTLDGVEFEGGKGENYPLVLGSGSFIPGFEDQLIGHKAGDQVDVTVTFPENYGAEDLAGKEAVFACTVKEGKKKILSELNDDFAQDVSECKTMAELEEQIKTELEKANAKNVETQKENLAIAALIEDSTCEIPKSMLDVRLDQLLDNFGNQLSRQGLSFEKYLQLTGASATELRDQFKGQAEGELKTEFILEAVAKAENIEVGEAELDAEYAKMAEEMNKTADEVKEIYGKNETMVESLKFNIMMNTAIKVLTSNATYDKKPSEKDDKEVAEDKPAKKSSNKADKEETEEKPAKKTTKKADK